MPKTNGKKFSITIRDEDIIRAAKLWKETTPHEDAPGMSEAVRLRNILEEVTGKDLDMLCVLWLRNRFVQLRKGGKLKA